MGEGRVCLDFLFLLTPDCVRPFEFDTHTRSRNGKLLSNDRHVEFWWISEPFGPKKSLVLLGLTAAKQQSCALTLHEYEPVLS